jgi:hypothetical protein
VNNLVGVIDLKPFHINRDGGVGYSFECTDAAAALNCILGPFDVL